MQVSTETLLGAAITIIGVVLANSLTFGRNTKEKLWELRRHAYGAILSELSFIEDLCDAADEDIERDGATVYFHAEISNSRNGRIWARLSSADARIAEDYLIISQDFLGLYERFRKERSENESDLPTEEHRRVADALRKYRPRLIAQARSEMPFAGAFQSALSRLLSRTPS